MKKEIILVDREQGIVRCTLADERFYLKTIPDAEGIPHHVEAVPSSSWIASYYYTSPYLIKWIAERGISEAEFLKTQAGFKGSRVHLAISMWLQDIEIKIDTKIAYEGKELEMTPEENECFKSFIDFYTEIKPEVLGQEYTVWGNGYAGTVDLKCKINGELGILDFKTSQAVYKSHEIQISSYKHADPDKDKIQKLWVLQLGYRKNKAKWKLTEIEDKFKLFLNAKDTWAEENKNVAPKYIVYPISYPTKKMLDETKITNK